MRSATRLVIAALRDDRADDIMTVIVIGGIMALVWIAGVPIVHWIFTVSEKADNRVFTGIGSESVLASARSVSVYDPATLTVLTQATPTSWTPQSIATAAAGTPVPAQAVSTQVVDGSTLVVYDARANVQTGAAMTLQQEAPAPGVVATGVPQAPTSAPGYPTPRPTAGPLQISIDRADWSSSVFVENYPGTSVEIYLRKVNQGNPIFTPSAPNDCASLSPDPNNIYEYVVTFSATGICDGVGGDEAPLYITDAHHEMVYIDVQVF